MYQAFFFAHGRLNRAIFPLKSRLGGDYPLPKAALFDWGGYRRGVRMTHNTGKIVLVPLLVLSIYYHPGEPPAYYCTYTYLYPSWGHIQPVTRAIEVSHANFDESFRERISSELRLFFFSLHRVEVGNGISLIAWVQGCGGFGGVGVVVLPADHLYVKVWRRQFRSVTGVCCLH